MKTVQDAYLAYRIMPSLQLHQLRVAAVAKVVCDHFEGELDKDSIVLACLFHDMGNILKSDLTIFPDFVQPEGLEYWEGVKKDFAQKYGPNEHTATSAITREIGIPASSITLIEKMGFSKMKEIQDGGSFELKILEYGDCRVAPRGIVPAAERFAEGSNRYTYRYTSSEEMHTHFLYLTDSAYEIEKQIFSHCSIRPEDITNESVAPLFDLLRNLEIA